MNTWRMRGWSASQVRVATLKWLERLSVITASSPVVAAALVRLAVTAAPATAGRWGLGFGPWVAGCCPTFDRLAYHEGANHGWPAWCCSPTGAPASCRSPTVTAAAPRSTPWSSDWRRSSPRAEGEQAAAHPRHVPDDLGRRPVRALIAHCQASVSAAVP
jgi:hypothetical protein